jgi:hypothetical protein
VNPYWLRHGGPGDGLQSSTPWAFAAGSAGGATTVINTYGDGWHQSNTSAAASWLESRGLEYRLYAYSQEQAAFTQTTGEDSTTGDMCSGTILEASQVAWGGFWRQPYSAAARFGYATAIFPALRDFINNTYGGFGCGLPLTPPCPNGSNIAAQVVNCFAFDACGAPDWCWQTYGTSCFSAFPNDLLPDWNVTNPGSTGYIGDGSTVSPDDIVDEIGYAGGTQTNYYPLEHTLSTSAPYTECNTTCTGGCYTQ